MKKSVFKPGYEFIFTLSVLVLLGLPPLVFGQSKDLQITIANGDTTVNGKNIRDLSPGDRKEALGDIGNISGISNVNKPGRHKIYVQSIQTDSVMANGDVAKSGRTYRRNKFRTMGRDSALAFNYRTNGEPGDGRKAELKEWRLKYSDENAAREFGHKNTQNFSYTNTDAQGISTHVSYRVSEPSGAVNHGAGDNGNPQFDVLELKDLTLVPQFEAGKTVIAFSLPSKAVAEVQFKDSENNVIWSEKATNGQFMKAFNLGLNGVYYLHVKQGNKLAVKKIFKE